MESNEAACTIGEEGELARRYVVGHLDEDEAEHFEAHYFECDACWGDVRRALEVRAAVEPDDQSAPAGPGAAARRWGWPLLAAAAVGGILIGTWQAAEDPTDPPAADVLRGPAAELPVRVEPRAAGLVAAWPSLAEADRYTIRLFTAAGDPVLEREVTDTVLALDSAPPPADGLYLQVEALDAVRNVVARSGLEPVPAPADSS